MEGGLATESAAWNFQFLLPAKHSRLGKPTFRGPGLLKKNLLGWYVGNALAIAAAKVKALGNHRLALCGTFREAQGQGRAGPPGLPGKGPARLLLARHLTAPHPQALVGWGGEVMPLFRGRRGVRVEDR